MDAARIIRPIYCSFCGKRRDEVSHLISGPGPIYICNECVLLCLAIIEPDRQLEEIRRLGT